MTDKEIMKKLVDALEIGLKFLPDSYYYGKEEGDNWVWEECTDDEQEAIKGARRKMNEARKAYLEHIKGNQNVKNT